MDSLVDVYGDSLAIISYNETFISAEVHERLDYYGNPVDPTVIFDGDDEIFVEDPGSFVQTYEQHITAAQADTPSFNFGITATASDSSGTVWLHIGPTDTLSEGSLMAFVAICEDSVDGVLKDFNYVCRYLYEFPINLSFPDSLDTTIVFTNTLNPTKMRAVAFVQDLDTKKVMQAITKKFEED